MGDANNGSTELHDPSNSGLIDRADLEATVNHVPVAFRNDEDYDATTKRAMPMAAHSMAFIPYASPLLLRTSIAAGSCDSSCQIPILRAGLLFQPGGPSNPSRCHTRRPRIVILPGQRSAVSQ